MVSRINQQREERDQGFTLIELLVVIIVIGILSAIAVPVFLNQRGKGVDASVKADLHNASLAVESFATEYPASEEVYIDDLYSNGFRESPGNQVTVTGGPAVGYCLYGYNESGSSYVSADTALTYDSLAGGVGQSGAACSGHPDLTAVASPPCTYDSRNVRVTGMVEVRGAEGRASWTVPVLPDDWPQSSCEGGEENKQVVLDALVALDPENELGPWGYAVVWGPANDQSAMEAYLSGAGFNVLP